MAVSEVSRKRSPTHSMTRPCAPNQSLTCITAPAAAPPSAGATKETGA